ncbi:hypothetical protein PMZ80_003475 [Knufia obscura]|uniref:O-methyltransferase C-terminal domain-containing protein n=1 Tax=Knufia obscura TaxID=1635080 RepID=A0ABR0RVF0_9EURO|nr:hypothetical protein PMZ80_003475 [Knufia obscura]
MAQVNNGIGIHDEASDVLQSLNKNAEALRAGNKQARDAMVSDCFRLVASLETPGEAFMRIMWTHSIYPPVIRLASDLKVFDLLKDAEGASKSSVELAKAAGADVRLMSAPPQVSILGITDKETDADSFASTEFANAMADQTYKNTLGLMTPYAASANLTTPEYFKKRDYRWPEDPMDTPVQYPTGDSGKMSFFDMMKRDDQFKGLEGLMKVWLNGRPHWSDEGAGFYPIRKRLIEGADKSPDAAFLVDVGGGHGQDFPRLLANVPETDIPGRLVLQDQPHVIAEITESSLPASVEKMGYDFFTPQPIQGARAYFMHNILHNHTDDKCKLILKQVARAMKKGYSKLLVWDVVMPDQGAGTNVCCLDWEMLTFYATSERTETEWRKLLQDPEIGLKVTDIVHYSRYDQDLIEVELA